MKKNLTRATVGSSREIWCSNRETGRFDEKLGDSRENRESWQGCIFYQFTVITDQAAGHDQVTGQVTELCGDYSVLAGFAYANDAYFTKSVFE